MGRFINSDVDASTGHGLLGGNMFAYCANNPVNYTDASGKDWWHWAAAAAIVVVAAVAVIATAGGVAGAALAITAVANGVAVSSTATTVAAGVFIGSSVALASSAYSAALESDSVEEFAQYGEEALISTAAGGGFGGLSAYSLPGHNCFIAGTLVLADQGYIPIENVSVGTLVWAWDEETGTVALKKVVETYVNKTNEFVHVYVDGEEIVTTPDHPFYSPVKGWTAAVHLRAGDILVLVNGEYVVVEKIQHEILEEPVEVYNFQVEDYHTYFVSRVSVLVHNECKIFGGGHGNQIHSDRIDDQINTLADSGNYAEIYGNRSLNTAGQIGNQRPDITAIRHDGTVEVWEFASKSQATGTSGYTALVEKIKTMKAANPAIIFHDIIPWE